jgi:hypothetical protein
VRTLIIHDVGPPVLILEEPCQGSVCRHTRVCTRGGLSVEQQTPCFLQVLLQGNQISDAPEAPEALGTSSSNEQYLSVFATTHCDKTQNRNATLILHQYGRFQQYAIPASFVADVFMANAGEQAEDGEESDCSETSSDGGTDLDIVRQEGGSGMQPRELSVAEKLPFSKPPCLFCKEDALRPRLSAGGAQALLLVQNNSFGYTCERCNDRT